MMMGTVAAHGGSSMAAKFRSRLRQLMLERSAKEGRLLTQKDVEAGSQVPYHTIQRWYDNDEPFERIDAKVLYPLLDYFECGFDDLIERVE